MSKALSAGEPQKHPSVGTSLCGAVRWNAETAARNRAWSQPASDRAPARGSPVAVLGRNVGTACIRHLCISAVVLVAATALCASLAEPPRGPLLKNYRLVAVLVVSGVAIAAASFAQPRFTPIPASTLLAGSPLHVPLDGIDPSGQALTYTVVVSDPLVTATVVAGSRSLRIQVATYGTMVFQLFDGRVRRVTNRIATLADSGFYNGVIFHRIINDFVIQGGDPTGTGAGGSSLGNFDDKFHVDLQHNRTGLLSMAKAADDTNDSQFFITAGVQRHLDFNHSIFGLLIEGESVRQRISNVAVDPNNGDRPLADVVMESVSTFVDTQNAVLMLKAPEGATSAVDVTVTVQNTSGASTSQTFRVNVTPDTIDSPPFLADIPEITTPIDTTVTYQLVARDVEGNPALYLDQSAMTANGLPVPLQAPLTMQYTVDFNTGLLTIFPTAGIRGPQRIAVATAASPNAVDYQVVTVVVGAPPEEPTTSP